MSNSIILNSEILKKINNSEYEEIHFSTKKARNGYYNFFIHPNVGIRLYNAKVSWIDGYKKNLCFCYKKYENLNLLDFLKNVNYTINSSFKNFRNVDKDVSLFYEKDDVFYIKCFIKVNEIIRVGNVYSSVDIDLRNIWENEDKNLGINLELRKLNI